MSTKHRMRGLAGVLALGLALTACGGGDDDASTSTTKGATSAPPTFTAGSTMETLQKKGKLVAGVKFDQRGFGLKSATSGTVEGFDVEVAKQIGIALFGSGGDSKVEFKEAISANRETFIQNGDVDVVVATYTINDARKEKVSFAGPYFSAKQDIMVKKGDASIKSVTDLAGKKVCSVQGSTSLKNLQAKAPTADTSITFGKYTECAEALADGRVQAVTTDNVILAGLVADSAGKFALVNAPFTEEPYGIGLKKDDTAFRGFLNDLVEKIEKDGTYKQLFDKTVGKDGLPFSDPPAINRY
jgi:glutamate transport system substrate-binding protein